MDFFVSCYSHHSPTKKEQVETMLGIKSHGQKKLRFMLYLGGIDIH